MDQRLTLIFYQCGLKETLQKWEPNYFISNQLTDEKGSLKQWVTSGHDLTIEVEEKK